MQVDSPRLQEDANKRLLYRVLLGSKVQFQGVKADLFLSRVPDIGILTGSLQEVLVSYRVASSSTRIVAITVIMQSNVVTRKG